MSRRLISLLIVSLATIIATMTASAAAPVQSVLAELPHVSFPAPHRVASGVLRAGDIAALKNAGVREVINLSAASETPNFDEAEAMRSAGITYRHLPIRGADDLTRANVIRFDELLADAGDHLTLTHCASSNRVGAMIALRAAVVGGQSSDAALAAGRRWGLKSLEPAVRQRLESWAAAAAPNPASGR